MGKGGASSEAFLCPADALLVNFDSPTRTKFWKETDCRVERPKVFLIYV
jgi:hypothetical protein